MKDYYLVLEKARELEKNGKLDYIDTFYDLEEDLDYNEDYNYEAIRLKREGILSQVQIIVAFDVNGNYIDHLEDDDIEFKEWKEKFNVNKDIKNVGKNSNNVLNEVFKYHFD